MKLSQIDKAGLASLSVEQINRIVFGFTPTGDHPATAALLLGANPRDAEARARAAARLFGEGLVPRIVPTGGVRHETRLGEMTEAEFMARILLDLGIPGEAVVVENEAATTRENMLLGMLAIERACKPRGPEFHIYIVTSTRHMRRSMALARTYLPRTARILGRAAEVPGSGPGDWSGDQFWTAKVMIELNHLKWFVDHGEIEDIEF